MKEVNEHVKLFSENTKLFMTYTELAPADQHHLMKPIVKSEKLRTSYVPAKYIV